MNPTRLRTSDKDARISHAILDGFGDAIIICDRTMTIYYGNRAAHHLLTGCVILELSFGRVSLTIPENVQLVQAVCRSVDRNASSSMVIDHHEHGQYRIRIDPVLDALASVTVRGMTHFARMRGEAAALQYGFTQSECSLATSLLEGTSLESHAARRDLRMSTVRSHLSALLSKTGTKRQAELVSLILASPDPVGSLAPG
jgi:DNA-binding CsgD family transcriptional regulator